MLIINDKVTTARVSGALTAVVMTIVHLLLDLPVVIPLFGYYQLLTVAPTSVATTQWDMFFLFFLAFTNFGTIPPFWIYFMRIPAFRSFIFCRSPARSSTTSDGVSSQGAAE